MATLTDDMRRMIEEQRLVFIATVCPDGTPNLSPSGTTLVWDNDHLVFAGIHAQNTFANLKQNPAVELNVVDWFTRQGYRFKGTATVLESGELFAEVVAFYDRHGLPDAPHRIQAVGVVEVRQALPLISPGYDSGATEEEMRLLWENQYQQIRLKM